MNAVHPGRFDSAEWKRSKRSGREHGCWTYIAAEQLALAGIDPHDPAPLYRLTATPASKKGVGRFFLNVRPFPSVNGGPE